jgi:glycosyltransferase involved in cell wall biosynthesis
VTILFLISSEGFYGAESHLLTLAEALRDAGCNCVLAVFCDVRQPHTEVAEHASRRGLTVELIPCRGRLDWRAVVHIRELIRNHRADIVHPQGYKSDIYAYASSLGQPCGLVATSHNWPSTLWSMRAYAVLDRQILRKFDRIVVLSKQVHDRLIRAGVVRRKVCTIPNGIDLERFVNAEPTLRAELTTSNPIVGFVGRLVEEKGGQVLLHAAKQVLHAKPNAILVFVGDGPCRQSWQGLSNRLGIGNQVVFTGKRNDMAEVYASCDVVVLPSLVEAMPMCLLEAMAAGKPVVASAVGSIPEMITPQRTGLLVAPGDSNALARSILAILNDHELAHGLGKSARMAVATTYSAEVMARSYLELYQDVMGQNLRAQGHPRVHPA